MVSLSETINILQAITKTNYIQKTSPEYKLCLYMQDMQQVPRLILEYTWVLLNIMLHQTKVFIMKK